MGIGLPRWRLANTQVSNYRANQTLDEYLKAQGVLGIADVDTRAITRRLRTTGCLNGVITTDESLTDEELVEKTRVRGRFRADRLYCRVLRRRRCCEAAAAIAGCLFAIRSAAGRFGEGCACYHLEGSLSHARPGRRPSP